jgi:hypothetical protein
VDDATNQRLWKTIMIEKRISRADAVEKYCELKAKIKREKWQAKIRGMDRHALGVALDNLSEAVGESGYYIVDDTI